MPAFSQGKRHTLLDRTVQSVVVDVGIVLTDRTDREAASIVARQVELIDPGLADPTKALKDETAVFIAGSRRDRDPIGGRDFHRRLAGEVVKALPSTFVARHVEEAGA